MPAHLRWAGVAAGIAFAGAAVLWPSGEPVAAVVGGEPVLMVEVQRYADALAAAARQTDGGDLQAGPALQRVAATTLIMDRLVGPAAADLDIDVDAALGRRGGGAPSPVDPQDPLGRYRERFERTTAAATAQFDGAVADELLTERFGEQPVALRHILVDGVPLAEELATRLDGGADFADLAARYSTDPVSAEAGGRLGAADPTSYPEPLAAAIDGLEPGQRTGPVVTAVGVHIVERLADPDRSDLVRQVRDEAAADWWAGRLRATAEQVGVEVHPDLGRWDPVGGKVVAGL